MEIINMYNGEGLRVAKQVNGDLTRYLYEHDKVVLEVDSNIRQKARNVYGTNLLTRTVDEESYDYMYNGHGDVTKLLDTAGNTAASYYYDAWGNVEEQTGNVNNSVMYAGYQYDKETGMYYLNSRMYDPTTARFLQEDTVQGDLKDPLSLNLYTYCHSNPLKYYDPDGHWPRWLDNGIKKLRKATGRFVSRLDHFNDNALKFVDKKVNKGITYVNKKVDKGFEKVEKKFKIKANNHAYNFVKTRVKESIGIQGGVLQEALSIVTGTAHLAIKHNIATTLARDFNHAVDFTNNPKEYFKKAENSFKLIKEMPKQVKNYMSEQMADPYKRGNLQGRAMVFVASLAIGAGEAKAASTVSKVEESAGALSKVAKVAEVSGGEVKAGTLSNLEARTWYLQQESKIPTMIDKNLSLEQQARQAVNLRNQFRVQARDLMADRELAASINKTDPNLSWEQIVKKYTDKGFHGDSLYKEVINAAQRSRTSINESLGIK